MTEPPYSLELHRRAQRTIERGRLPRDLARAIRDQLLALSRDPRPAACLTLQGPRHEGRPLLRVRVGDYRIVYTVFDDERRILVLRIAHRRDVYRR